MKVKITSLLETIIALCILLECESVWKWMHHSGYFRLILTICFMGSLLILSIIKVNPFSKHDKILLEFLVIYFTGLLGYNSIFNSSNALETFQFIFTLLLMVIYFKDNNNILSVMERCSKILCCLAVISLVFWLLGSVSHLFTPHQSLTVYTNDIAKIKQSYFYLHYEMQMEEILGTGVYRNTGIFYEGPKYVLLLSLFLMYELFISQNKKYKRCTIFTVTAITTMSMTGIYAIILIWILYIFTRYSSKSIKGLLLRIVFICFFLALGSRIITFLVNTFSMKMETASYGTRIDNYRAGYAAWKEHLLMGAGYLNMDTIYEHFSAFRMNDIGYSNSIFRLLAQGGLYLGIIYFVPLLKVVIEGVRKKNKAVLSFILMYIYFFVTTSFTYNYINYLVLCMFFFFDYSLKDKIRGAKNEYIK